MDIAFLKTFLEVNRTRHFGQAANNLYITQSTVSSRIKQLEESLGAAVFTRKRNAIELTPTGQRLLTYAENIVTTWNKARIETGLADEDKIPLTIAGVPSLWDIALQDWLNVTLAKENDFSLQVDVLSEETIINRLRNSTLDMGFVFDIPSFPELEFREIADVSLVLVSNKPHESYVQALQDNYILVDWGTSFASTHASYFPDMPTPSLRIGLGRIAKELLLSHGGSAYIPKPMIEAELNEGQLHQIDDAPVIKRVFYSARPANSDKAQILDELLSEWAN